MTLIKYLQYHSEVGRDSSVGIVTRYGLDGLGIESRWGRDFPYPSRQALGLTQPPAQWVLGLFPVGKVARAWCRPPNPQLAPRLKKQWSFTSTPPLCLHGRLKGKLCFNITRRV
jgi:hypothetical protein